jgi:hypothetical protein
MCEHCEDGRKISASPERLAAYSKLSKRAYWYTIQSLRKRGILSQTAPGSAKEQRSAIYRINQAAFEDDPRMTQYLDKQENLPGIDRPWESMVPNKRGLPCAINAQARKAGAADDVTHLVQPLHEPCANFAVDLVQPLHEPCAINARDSNPIDSNPSYSKPSDSQTGPDSKRGVFTIPPVVDDRPAQQTQTFSDQVHEIASLHPKIYDAFHLPTEVHGAIAAAIKRDGRDLVWAGTKTMSNEVARWPRDELQYLSSPVNFFRKSEYRKDAAEWKRKEKGKANDYAERCDREDEFLQRRRSRATGAG